MNATEKYLREESLAAWRLAANMTFNGLLINTLFSGSTCGSDAREKFLLSATPTLGILVSLSFLIVGYMGLEVKFDSILENMEKENISSNPSKIRFYILQSLGPYIFTSLLLLCFWIWYLIAT